MTKWSRGALRPVLLTPPIFIGDGGKSSLSFMRCLTIDSPAPTPDPSLRTGVLTGSDGYVSQQPCCSHRYTLSVRAKSTGHPEDPVCHTCRAIQSTKTTGAPADPTGPLPGTLRNQFFHRRQPACSRGNDQPAPTTSRTENNVLCVARRWRCAVICGFNPRPAPTKRFTVCVFFATEALS